MNKKVMAFAVESLFKPCRIILFPWHMNIVQDRFGERRYHLSMHSRD